MHTVLEFCSDSLFFISILRVSIEHITSVDARISISVKVDCFRNFLTSKEENIAHDSHGFFSYLSCSCV